MRVNITKHGTKIELTKRERDTLSNAQQILENLAGIAACDCVGVAEAGAEKIEQVLDSVTQGADVVVG